MLRAPTKPRDHRMESYDLFMLLVLGAVTLFGFMKGFVWQIAWMASFVVSAIAALRLGPVVSAKYPESPLGTPIVAGLAVFIATSAAIWIAFRFVSGFIDRMKLDSFDHQMGAILGFARGVLWCIGITYFALGVPLLSEAQRDNIVASQSGRYIVMLLDKAHPLLPAEVHEQLHPVFVKVRRRFDPNYQPEFQMPNIPLDNLRGYIQNQAFPNQASPNQGYQSQGQNAPQQQQYNQQQYNQQQQYPQQQQPYNNYQPREFTPPYNAGQQPPANR